MTIRPPYNARSRVSPRLGMTLTELLVVIMIMAFLLGAALPVMRVAMEDRAMREASRQLNTYVQLAKSQAAEKGRPVGLWLETQSLPEGTPADARYCQQLFIAETPPPYAGDMVGARARTFDAWNNAVGPNNPVAPALVNPTGTPPIPPDGVADTAEFDASSASLPLLVGIGDTIKFNYQGHLYEITDVAANVASLDSTVTTLVHRITFHHATVYPFGRPYPLPLPANPNRWLYDYEIPKHISPPINVLLPFQILRSPQKSSVTPMEFSGGAVIDLSVSGVGLTGREFATATTPVIIMFSPTGSVDRILGQGMPVIPPSTIHLLIGSLSNMMEPGENSTAFSVDYNKNLEVTANLWVSISLHTGTVVTAQNAWEPRADFNASLGAAREFAQQSDAMGGR